jgi:hypothetical protein
VRAQIGHLGQVHDDGLTRRIVQRFIDRLFKPINGEQIDLPLHDYHDCAGLGMHRYAQQLLIGGLATRPVVHGGTVLG